MVVVLNFHAKPGPEGLPRVGLGACPSGHRLLLDVLNCFERSVVVVLPERWRL